MAYQSVQGRDLREGVKCQRSVLLVFLSYVENIRRKQRKSQKNGITSQHSDISAMCCDVIPYFVIFAVFYV